ncbi:MAG: hypothetical protein KG012_03375 [Deltaproteobacteria bacterium]|nr:hypothetical protein [Deltaproteobacteria bacterium]
MKIKPVEFRDYGIREDNTEKIFLEGTFRDLYLWCEHVVLWLWRKSGSGRIGIGLEYREFRFEKTESLKRTIWRILHNFRNIQFALFGNRNFIFDYRIEKYCELEPVLIKRYRKEGGGFYKKDYVLKRVRIGRKGVYFTIKNQYKRKRIDLTGKNVLVYTIKRDKLTKRFCSFNIMGSVVSEVESVRIRDIGELSPRYKKRRGKE